MRNRFQTAMMREPIELMKYIVKNDKPWTDMVAGKYTVVNGVQAQYLAARVTGTFTSTNRQLHDNEFLPAVLPNGRLAGDREHAGVISTHAWLQRFPTTPTNRNRHRVYIMAKQFLATDVAALAARPIDDGGDFKIPTVENTACAACHATIDPIAASWQNWNENNRYLPFRTGGRQGPRTAGELPEQQLSEGQGRQGLLRRRRQLVPRRACPGLRHDADARRRHRQQHRAAVAG